MKNLLTRVWRFKPTDLVLVEELIDRDCLMYGIAFKRIAFVVIRTQPKRERAS